YHMALSIEAFSPLLLELVSGNGVYCNLINFLHEIDIADLQVLVLVYVFEEYNLLFRVDKEVIFCY
ncbi:unnamed protein product, partial [Fusarium graminearum]